MIRTGCKINLGLEISGRRQDGYHELKTLFYPLDEPADELFIEIVEEPGPDIICDAPDIPRGGNILAKAWAAFAKFHKPKTGAKIRLVKGISVQAGLGGGSSDAAALLLWLNKIHDFPLSLEELRQAALSTGADVPFFLDPTPCFACGRGEIITPIKFMGSGYYILLVCPSIGVSTGWAFAKYDEISQNTCPENDLTNIFDKDKAFILSNAVLEKIFSGNGLRNDLEAIVFPHFPELARIKSMLLNFGAIGASMSGSGSSIFGIFTDKGMGLEAMKFLQNANLRTYFTAMRDYC